MATYRKLLYSPSFSSQTSQTDKTSGRENSRHKLTEATPSPLLYSKSPEITPRFSKRMKTNHLLRFYSNMRTWKKSTVNLRESEGGKSQCVERDACRGPSSLSTFEFPPRDARTVEEMSQTKLDVLRTIKKMLEENRVIRERLLALRQSK